MSEQSPSDFSQAPSPWSVQGQGRSHQCPFISLDVTYPTQLLGQCQWTMRPKVIIHQTGVCSKPFHHSAIDVWISGESACLPLRTTVYTQLLSSQSNFHVMQIYLLQVLDHQAGLVWLFIPCKTRKVREQGWGLGHLYNTSAYDLHCPCIETITGDQDLCAGQIQVWIPNKQSAVSMGGQHFYRWKGGHEGDQSLKCIIKHGEDASSDEYVANQQVRVNCCWALVHKEVKLIFTKAVWGHSTKELIDMVAIWQ